MQHYVYFLIDPRDRRPFYIGKGQKKRMYRHVSNVRKGRVPNSNPRLGNKIQKILSLGLKIEYKKVFVTDCCQKAFDKEKELIEKIGLSNLCNLRTGGKGGTYIDEVRKQISKKLTNRKQPLKQRLEKSRRLKGRKIVWKDKISRAHEGKIFSKETRMRMSRSKNRMNRKEWTNSNTGEITFLSCTEMSEKTGLSISSFSHLVKGRLQQTKCGWTLKSREKMYLKYEETLRSMILSWDNFVGIFGNNYSLLEEVEKETGVKTFLGMLQHDQLMKVVLAVTNTIWPYTPRFCSNTKGEKCKKCNSMKLCKGKKCENLYYNLLSNKAQKIATLLYKARCNMYAHVTPGYSFTWTPFQVEKLIRELITIFNNNTGKSYLIETSPHRSVKEMANEFTFLLRESLKGVRITKTFKKVILGTMKLEEFYLWLKDNMR